MGAAGVVNLRTISKWYIDNTAEEDALSKTFIVPLRFLLLNSSMIPISLKVTLEVCKVIYSLFINYDEHLFCRCLPLIPSDSNHQSTRMARLSTRSLHSISASMLNNTTPAPSEDPVPELQATLPDPASAQESRLAYCNSSCLSENLGQVKYIFTDKTGTLTKNEMILKYCHVLDRQWALSWGLSDRIVVVENETMIDIPEEATVCAGVRAER